MDKMEKEDGKRGRCKKEKGQPFLQEIKTSCFFESGADWPARSLFVKTIDSNDPANWRNGLTPSRWLTELSECPAARLFRARELTRDQTTGGYATIRRARIPTATTVRLPPPRRDVVGRADMARCAQARTTL